MATPRWVIPRGSSASLQSMWMGGSSSQPSPKAFVVSPSKKHVASSKKLISKGTLGLTNRGSRGGRGILII